MFKISTAKRLFAMTAILFPLDVFLYGQNLGWGTHTVFGRYVNTVLGSQFHTQWQLFEAQSGLSSTSQVALYAWSIAAIASVLATLYLLVTWVVESPLSERQSDRAVGGAFMTAGALFILSRALLYDYLIIGPSSDLYWLSVPIGAAYMLFVGLVFYRDLFQVGMETTDTASAAANDG